MPDIATIEVADEHEDEVQASSALLHFVVTGSRFFTGAAALKEAIEVRRLVEALAAAGVPETAVRLEGVSVDVSKGLITRSSTATYQVRAQLKDPQLLPAVLDGVSSLKNCNLSYLEWEYDATPHQPKWLARCVERARIKAEALAAALGGKLDGVLRVRELKIGEAREAYESMAPGAPMMMRARGGGGVSSELSGMELAPTRKMGVKVEIVYRLKDA